MKYRSTDFNAAYSGYSGYSGRRRGSSLDIWQKLSRCIVVLLAAAGIGTLISKFWPELRRQTDLDRQIAALQDREKTLREKRDLLKQEYEWLRDDPDYQEIVARDRLGLRREGETIVRIRREP